VNVLHHIKHQGFAPWCSSHTNVKIQYTRGARLNVQPQHSFMQDFLTDGYIQNEQMLNNWQINALVWVHAQWTLIMS
jgi:hypothetical protein